MTALLSCVLVFAAARQGVDYDPAKWTESPSKLVSGWTEFKLAGIRISYPPGWTAIIRKKEDLATPKGMLAPEIENSSFFKKAKSAKSQTKTRFFIYDSEGEDDFRVRSTLRTGKVDIGLADYLKLGKKSFEAMHCQTKIWYVDIPVGRAGLLETEAKLSNGQTLLTHIYVIDRNGSRYIVDFLDESSNGYQIEQLSLQIMKTFRFAN